MEHEQVESPAFDEQACAWDVFQYWTGSQDRDRFRQAYLGHYANREAFGQALLAEYGADERLAQLPRWLRGYIRVDAAAFVADFERAGHYYVHDAPHDQGTFVFDGYA